MNTPNLTSKKSINNKFKIYKKLDFMFSILYDLNKTDSKNSSYL